MKSVSEYVAGCRLQIHHRIIRLPVTSDSHAQVKGLFVAINLLLENLVQSQFSGFVGLVSLMHWIRLCQVLTAAHWS